MKRNTKFFYPIVISIILLLIFSLTFAIYIYFIAFKPNIKLSNGTYSYIKVPTNSDYYDVLKIIDNEGIVKNINTFEKLAEIKNYPNHVYAGRYFIRNRMNNNRLINTLRSGKQEPLNLIFNNIRTKERLAQVISNQIEADSATILNLLDSNEIIDKFGFTKETIIAMFIPNTYEFYWNTNAYKFINRMHQEYNRFWNSERLERADEIGLSPVEVSILASIVDEEVLIDSELRRVAGVYMNRLRKKIALHADPTIRFALGDFTIRRILSKDLEINSPYNTYKHRGLPPGPISIPSIAAIDAVLNYESHKYLYFCAKEDFSGYHNFAKTLKEHNRNAELYREALNDNKVYR